MSDNISLLDRAKFDLIFCEKILENFDDDLAKDASAFHLSQAVEKALKFRINSYGVEYPLTYRFGKLIEVLEELGENIPEWLINNSDTLDEYATKTQYSDCSIAEKKKINELAKFADSLLVRFEPEEVYNDWR